MTSVEERLRYWRARAIESERAAAGIEGTAIILAARAWARARLAVVNLPIDAPDYRERLNALSEAEDRLRKVAT